MNFDINIGIIAPSRTGKTSLIAAMYLETEQRLRNSIVEFKTAADDTLVKAVIDKVYSDYKTCIPNPGQEWKRPDLLATQADKKNITGTVEYKFVLRKKNDSKQKGVSVSILDYPGGWIGTTDFIKHVEPFLNKCSVVLVPISTDYLMEWFACRCSRPDDEMYSLRSHKSLEFLEDKSVCDAINNWMAKKYRNNQYAQLIFVPVKCEKWFPLTAKNGTNPINNFSIDSFYSISDLIKTNPSKALFDFFSFTGVNPSALVFKAIDELYFKKISYTSGLAELLNISVFCVDTYGIIELNKMALVSSNGDKVLEPHFISRNNGRIIQYKNAFETLAAIIKFNFKFKQQQLRKIIETNKNKKDSAIRELERLKEKRGLLKKLFNSKTSEMTKLENEIDNYSHELSQNQIDLEMLNVISNAFPSEVYSERTKTYNPEKE